MSLCCADSLDHVCNDVVRIGFIDDLDEARPCDMDRRFAFQAEKNIIRTFATAFRNPLRQKFRPALDRNDRNTRVKRLSIGNYTSRNIYDGGQTIHDGRKALFGQSIEETMGPPMQRKMPSALGGLKVFGRKCIVVLRINMCNSRDNTARKNKAPFMSELFTREANQRVLTATRRPNDKNESSFLRVRI